MPTIRKLVLLLAGLCATPFAWSANALIVHDGTPGIEADALGNLTSKLTTATFTVTANVGVPAGSLATYQQIWDIRFNNTTPLTGADITAYTTYLAGGGNLFAMGENAGFATRNSSVQSLIAAAGGGSTNFFSPANHEFVRAPFTGPNAITDITFLAAGGLSSPPGSGGWVAEDGAGFGAAPIWGPGMLGNAPTGSLIAVFDVNFMQAGADANSQALVNNLIAYLAAPTPVARASTGPSIPTLQNSVLLALAGLLAGLGAWRLRPRSALR